MMNHIEEKKNPYCFWLLTITADLKIAQNSFEDGSLLRFLLGTCTKSPTLTYLLSFLLNYLPDHL